MLDGARRECDRLIVGLNSDASVRRLKGRERPVVGERERAFVLAGLESVDYVVLFEEDTPLRLITAVRPRVLVKGGDWPVERIVGREAVEAGGGRVVSLPLLPGYSTTALIQRIRDSR
jgi:rfaE bifunctional protein nucleotidyltransferase chain/domain